MVNGLFNYVVKVIGLLHHVVMVNGLLNYVVTINGLLHYIVIKQFPKPLIHRKRRNSLSTLQSMQLFTIFFITLLNKIV